MKLTPKQVAEKLGISPKTVLDMVKRGELKDSKPRDPNKKKHFALIDSKDLAEYIKQNGRPNGRIRRIPYPLVPVNPAGVLMRLQNSLDELNRKMDQLIGMWS